MKHLQQFLLTVLLALVSISASAYDFEVDGIYYYTSSNNTAYVTHNGDIYSDVPTYTGDIVIPSTVEYNETTYTVVGIGQYAFYRDSITSIVLPNTVTSIDNYAFYYCSSMTDCSMPLVETLGGSAFAGCSSLKEVSLPNATSIGNNAFGEAGYTKNGWLYTSARIYCNSLKRINIPLVTTIEHKAFYGCSSLQTVHLVSDTPPVLASADAFPDWTMLVVPDEAYDTYLAADVYSTIPLQITMEGHITKSVEVEADDKTSSLLKAIGEEHIGHVVNLSVSGTINSYDMMIMRNKMTSLRSLDLTNASIVDCSYEYYTGYHSEKDVVGPYWFYETKLINVKLPTTAKSIGAHAFHGCSSLQNVDMPSVTNIGSDAFSGCSSLQSVDMPSVTNIGSNAFSGCSSLQSVDIPNAISIGSYAFINCKEITIPKCVKKIGVLAFGKAKIVHINSWDDWLKIDIKPFNYITDNYSVFEGIDKLYIGESDTPVEEYVVPEGTKEIAQGAFGGFCCLKRITLPESLETIGNSAFYNCSGLTQIELKDNVKSIGERAFSSCTGLTKLVLPPYLKTVGQYAFLNCYNLEEVLIPAATTTIADYAFSGCSKLNKVIATTIEPISINQNTFSTYKTADVYAPKIAYYNYYWDTQWSQFLSVNEYEKTFGKPYEYKYFYLNFDFTIGIGQGTIHGSGDKAPDADLNSGSGLVVSGSITQELGTVHIKHNGNNGASIIGKSEGKVHIENLYVDIEVQKNRWYFFTFPFDLKADDIKFDGSSVWYRYDGEARALNGSGGWKKVGSGLMKAGNGYIFQGAVDGTLTVHAADVTIDARDVLTKMASYQSENKNDASWNLIGNANTAYYDIDNLDYDAPITVYNNNTKNYDAVRAGDDKYMLYPFQAFFVQKPEAVAAMSFDGTKMMTKTQSEKAQSAASKVAERRAGANAERKLINLVLSQDTISDRTRVVINPTKSTGYEQDCDAAKFIADGLPQIYSTDAVGNSYAINERPVDTGVVALAVNTPTEGVYTISATRTDCKVYLRDNETGSTVDLTKEDYTFLAAEKSYSNRFVLVIEDGSEATGIDDKAMSDIVAVETGAIVVEGTNADVAVYTVGGALVATHKGNGRINVAQGTYVVKISNKTIKVTVK